MTNTIKTRNTPPPRLVRRRSLINYSKDPNLLRGRVWVNGYLNDSTGAEAGYHDSQLCEYIDVHTVAVLSIEMHHPTYWYSKMYQYSEDKTYLGCTTLRQGTNTITLKDNSYYFRVVVPKNNRTMVAVPVEYREE